jgi:hypothetical protein
MKHPYHGLCGTCKYHDYGTDTHFVCHNKKSVKYKKRVVMINDCELYHCKKEYK